MATTELRRRCLWGGGPGGKAVFIPVDRGGGACVSAIITPDGVFIVPENVRRRNRTLPYLLVIVSGCYKSPQIYSRERVADEKNSPADSLGRLPDRSERGEFRREPVASQR